MGTSVISCSDAPPTVFEFSEHVLNFMVLFVEGFIVFDFGFTIFLWRYAWLNAFITQSLPEPVSQQHTADLLTHTHAFASYWGHEDVIKLLKENGANLELPNNEGQIPLAFSQMHWWTVTVYSAR